MLILKNSWK